MQAQKEAPPDMQCKDKFLLQSVKANDGVTVKDINAEMVSNLHVICLFCKWGYLWTVGVMARMVILAVQFSKEAGHVVEECKLRVLYVSPPQPPSPVLEGSEEGSPPWGSVSDNGNVNGTDLSTVSS
jgi:hypothetical protein